MHISRVLLAAITCLLLSTTAAGAGTAAYIQELQQHASDKVLWQEPEWLNLGHYRQSRLITGKYSSAVDDERFFYAANGNTAPQDELNATLAAFFSTEEAGNEHALYLFGWGLGGWREPPI